MAAPKRGAKKRAGAHKSAVTKRKQVGKGKPFAPGNPWRIKPGEVRNPGGRPRLLSLSYREWLEQEDEHGVTNATQVASSLGEQAIYGDVSAAKELRQATEGDKSFNFDLSHCTDEQLQRIAAGEHPLAVLADSGQGGAGASPAPAAG